MRMDNRLLIIVLQQRLGQNIQDVVVEVASETQYVVAERLSAAVVLARGHT